MAALFFWIQYMLMKRRAFIIKIIIPLHLLVFLGCLAGILNLFFGEKRFLRDFMETPMRYSFCYAVLFAVSVFPVWFFTRPRVKERFK